ncbi:MAG: hypothetical protein ACI8WB_002983 [Phenylobacterium sp.]|jgi:hypothetical protein
MLAFVCLFVDEGLSDTIQVVKTYVLNRAGGKIKLAHIKPTKIANRHQNAQF